MSRFCGRVALEALGSAEVRVVGRIRSDPVQNPPALFGCGERVQVLRRRPILGGIVLRVERVDLGRGLVRPDRVGDDRVDLLGRVLGEDVLAVHLLEQVCIGPRLDLLDDERRIPTGDRVLDPVRREVGHLVGIDEGLRRLVRFVGGATIPEGAPDVDPHVGVEVRADGAERGHGVRHGLAVGGPAGDDPRRDAEERIDLRAVRQARRRVARLGGVAGEAGVARWDSTGCVSKTMSLPSCSTGVSGTMLGGCLSGGSGPTICPELGLGNRSIPTARADPMMNRAPEAIDTLS